MSPRTPLLRPDRYFADRDLDSARVLLVLAVVAAAMFVGVLGVGLVVTANLDGTVMVENPDHVPEQLCDSGFDSTPEGCDEPAEVERNVDAVFWEAFGGLLVPLGIGLLLVALGTAALLHVGARLAGGGGGWVPAFQAVAWGAVPSVISLALGLGVLYVALDPVTVTASSDPSVAVETLEEQIRSVGPVTTVLGLVTLAWTVVIWRFCLEDGYDIDGQSAWAVAVAVGVLYAFGMLL